MAYKYVILEETTDERLSIAVKEKELLFKLLGKTLVTLEHIGSTAIPNIVAKPIVDFLGEVTSLKDIDTKEELLEKNGYMWRGEYGIPERRYIKKPSEGDLDLLHIHLFEVGHPQIYRHIIFRDYCIKHPEIAQKYSTLKMNLAKMFKNNPSMYQQGKSAFIERIIWLAQKEFDK